jgi:sterol desaturase/sphingolipid hydroxylase (fatty acid hydroxylase superfamily)
MPASIRRRRGRFTRDDAVSWGLHGLVVAGAAAAVAVDRRLRRGRFAEARVAAPAAAVAFYGLIWAVESRRPAREDWQVDAAEARTDGVFLASILVTQAAVQALVAPVRTRMRRTLGVHRLPTPVGVAIAVLTFDLVHSRVHHLSHRWGPAWRFHSVHHSPERLYWFNATRFHTVESFVDITLETLIVAVLGLSRDQHIGHDAVRALYGQLQHSNIRMRSGALDHVFSTPDLHRWHHSTVYAEGDTNYGAITSVWDRVFGTLFRPEDRDGPEQVGIGRMPDFPQTFVELERAPFEWAAIRERNADTWFDDAERTA